MSTNEDLQGVSNCYVFKSRLQEYAQKAGLHTPVYETVKEGPSHEPSFRSTVILNDVRYDSLSGFFNRKAAEQSAAEVALVELAKSGEVNQSITQPVHETGLCKNLLQEYAQKMNYAMPMYICKKDETPGRTPFFSCTVDIGGILYIGGSAKTKKEAEIKAARTALLAIQSNPSHASENQVGNLTVIPSRKRAAESVAGAVETSNAAPKPKKARFRRNSSKRKPSRNKKGRVHADNAGSEANINNGVESQATVTDESGLQEIANINNGVESHATVTDESGLQEIKSEAALPSEAIKNFENGVSTTDHEKETLVGDGSFALNSQGVSENGKSTELLSKEDNIVTVAAEASSEAIKNFESGVSTTDHEKQTLVGEGSFALNSQGVSENGNSTELLSKEDNLVTVAAEASSEAIKNFESGVSTTDHEKQTSVGEGSFALNSQVISENGKSTELLSKEDNIVIVAAEASSEAIENFESGVSTTDHEKQTLVGEGSFALNSQGISENGKSTELLSKEDNIVIVGAEASSEAIKNFESGVSTTDHEKQTLVGEGSFVLNSQGVSENGKSTELLSKEDNIVSFAAEVSSVPNRDTNGHGDEQTAVPNGDTNGRGDEQTAI